MRSATGCSTSSMSAYGTRAARFGRRVLRRALTGRAGFAEGDVQPQGARKARWQGRNRYVAAWGRALGRACTDLLPPLSPVPTVTQTVKEVLQSLVDDGIVDFEKIGAQNFYWAFPSKAVIKVGLLARSCLS